MGKYINVNRAWYYMGKRANPNTRSSEKLRKDYRIEFLTTDTGSHFFDGVEYPHKMNSVLITKPGQKCSSLYQYECYSVIFDSPDEAFKKQYLEPLPILINPIDINSIKKLFDDITRSVIKHGENNINTEGLILQLIHELYYYTQVVRSDNNKYREHDRQLADAVHFMTLNISSHINTNDIAAAAFMSRSNFCHVFKAIYGETPARYLLKLRLQKAQILLRNSTSTMLEIAEMCGFPNQQYLTYAYKRAFGITPSQYINIYVND